MKSSKVNLKVERLPKMERAKTLNFDLVIQRKEDIWDVYRKSMLIHSILTGFPIPPLYATKEGRIYNIIDGKQRLTSVISFIKDEFALDKNIPDVDGEKIAEKTFSQLPEEFQKKILNYEFELHKLEEVTTTELEQLFFRLNNGMPLRPIETTRAILGSRVLRFIEDIAETPFFAEKINLSKKARQRFVDQELILQILLLIHHRNSGFSSKEIREFVKELRQKELRDELKSKIQNVCYYLNEAFPTKQKFLRKLHIPMIFIIALENQEKARLISPKEFGKWCQHFFEHIPEEYVQATQSGSAKKENVQKRIAVMKEHHDRYFQDRLNKNVVDHESTEHEENDTNHLLQLKETSKNEEAIS